MTRDEMIKNMEELSKFLSEEIQYSTHAHERKAFLRWENTVDEIVGVLVSARLKDEDTDEQREFEARIERLRKEHDEMMRWTDEFRSMIANANANDEQGGGDK